jgi:hypothetical protein
MVFSRFQGGKGGECGGAWVGGAEAGAVLRGLCGESGSAV